MARSVGQIVDPLRMLEENFLAVQTWNREG